MVDEFQEIQNRIMEVIDEVECNEGKRPYTPLETKVENAVMLLYLIDVSKPIMRCKDKATCTFNRRMVQKRIEKLLAENAENHAYYVFGLVEILKREKAVEHLKYILSTGSYLKKEKGANK